MKFNINNLLSLEKDWKSLLFIVNTILFSELLGILIIPSSLLLLENYTQNSLFWIILANYLILNFIFPWGFIFYSSREKLISRLGYLLLIQAFGLIIFIFLRFAIAENLNIIINFLLLKSLGLSLGAVSKLIFLIYIDKPKKTINLSFENTLENISGNNWLKDIKTFFIISILFFIIYPIIITMLIKVLLNIQGKFFL